MGLLANLFRLIGPTFPTGYCPPTFQQLADDLFNGAQVTFLIDTGNFIYNYGTATPAPENRIFPWMNTDDGLWWEFKFGLWTSPVNRSDLELDFRKIWLPAAGTLDTAAWALDGGDGTDPSVPANISSYFGAYWTVDHTMDGRSPIGAGDIPASDTGSGTAKVGINQTTDSLGGTGEYAHLLTDPEGAVGQHVHPMGLNDTSNASSSAGFNIVGIQTVPTWQSWSIAGGAFSAPFAVTQASLYTMKANDGLGVTTVVHNNMTPYRAVWFLKHTIRAYRTRPA